MNQPIRTLETRPIQLPDSQLWPSLQEFRVDESSTPLSFVKRLARENRWPVKYAERVFNEYKRFVFLAVAAGHRVTPSDEVDQACR